MPTPLAFPLVQGVRHGYSSIELKMAGQIFIGFKSINYSRTRSRGLVRGNHPDPIGWTRGENEYKGDCEIYLAEWNLFQELLGGPGYGDVAFTVLVTYGENGFDTITDELIGCHMDGTDVGNGQGTDALARKIELNPLKILFNGKDDVSTPLGPPPGG
jgi:hypothetical protein